MASNGNILAIDIGGSHIKGNILNPKGEEQVKYSKLDTPNLATPEAVVQTILQLVRDMPEYEKVSVGFPGYIRNGVVFTAPNLGNERWKQIDLGQQISNALRKPVRLVNDADQLGLGVVSGKGLELAVTLGTGVGTACVMDGYLLPHLELAHHPIRKEILKTVFNYDRLYLGGGNASGLTIPLENNIHLFTNEDGIKGGAKLWDFPDAHHITTNYPK